MKPKLIPELEVQNLEASLRFYVNVVGFTVLYRRPEERFVFLDLEDAQLMLEEASGPGRRLSTAPLERPFGRGINFQVQVSNVLPLYHRILSADIKLLIALEERWYRRNEDEVGHKQFVVGDPDGYLLRFFEDLGLRRGSFK